MRLTRTRRFALARNTAARLLPSGRPEPGPRDDGADLEEAEPVTIQWSSGVRKPRVGLVRDLDRYPYWTKYRRFLRSNDIPFEIFDIHKSSWLRDAARFDMVVWRPMSLPQELDECRRKFSILESELGLLCYPSFAEAQLYEDKLTQFDLLRHHGLPVVDTFVSQSEEEVAEKLATCAFPIVWKIAAGSGSLGVELVRNRRIAERRVRRVFGSAGRRTYWPSLGQKNYVYLQKFVPDAGPDIRVIVVGSMLFGYHRDVPKGEFRASGMGAVRWDPPSCAAMGVARRAVECLGLPCAAVDLLSDSSGEHVEIIEVSAFIQIKSPAQLRLGGVPGAYVYDGARDEYDFLPMRVWLQELAIKQVLETRWSTRQSGGRGHPLSDDRPDTQVESAPSGHEDPARRRDG